MNNRSDTCEVQVQVNNRPVRLYGHNGRNYVEGKAKTPFTVKLKNNTASRKLFVLSVDGLSVMDGKPATDGSGGYIVEGFSSHDVVGWRTSLEHTNRFVFEGKDRSYAAGTGQTSKNCGVIGCVVYSEKEKPKPIVVKEYIKEYVPYYSPQPVWPRFEPPFRPYYPWNEPTWCSTSSGVVGSNGGAGNIGETTKNFEHQVGCFNNTLSSESAPETPSVGRLICANSAFNLGTGWGEEVSDRVAKASFDRGGVETYVEIFYDDLEGLKQSGVCLTKEPTVNLPVAFSGFCQPPNFV